MPIQVKRSFSFENVYLGSTAVVTGPKEFHGPLGKTFDKHYDDLEVGGCKSWERAEMKLFEDAIDICLMKEGIKINDINLIICGDLNNQIIVGNYVLKKYDVGYLGVFGACSTSIESMIIASMFIDGNNSNRILVGTSSHNATAERQFRYPTEYGGQKPPSITSTVTAAGVGIVTKEKTNIKITRATVGKVVDSTMNDSLDMGRAMSIAAYDTIMTHFHDFNLANDEYDLIVTGDLSFYGKEMTSRLLKESNLDIDNVYNDCGLMIYDREKQDVFAGGSGCGCCAAVTYAHITKCLKQKKYRKVLVVATGALHNPVLIAQKETIPVIAHAICLEGCD